MLACDAEAFRPLVTTDEDRSIYGLKNMSRLDEQDLFTEFLQHPVEFAWFLSEHWN
jgi:hypothetical protein